MKVDIHIHTNYSKDGMSGIKEMALVAIKKGMNAIAITDHSSIEGWEEAKKVSKELNFPIILGNEIYSKQGDIILDFTMGSGSTGEACYNTDRNFIGVEIDDKYFTIAKNRLRQLHT